MSHPFGSVIIRWKNFLSFHARAMARRYAVRKSIMSSIPM